MQRLRKRPLNEPDSSSEDEHSNLFVSPASDNRKKLPAKTQANLHLPLPPPAPVISDSSMIGPTLVSVENLHSNEISVSV